MPIAADVVLGRNVPDPPPGPRESLRLPDRQRCEDRRVRRDSERRRGRRPLQDFVAQLSVRRRDARGRGVRRARRHVHQRSVSARDGGRPSSGRRGLDRRSDAGLPWRLDWERRGHSVRDHHRRVRDDRRRRGRHAMCRLTPLSRGCRHVSSGTCAPWESARDRRRHHRAGLLGAESAAELRRGAGRPRRRRQRSAGGPTRGSRGASSRDQRVARLPRSHHRSVDRRGRHRDAGVDALRSRDGGAAGRQARAGREAARVLVSAGPAAHRGGGAPRR